MTKQEKLGIPNDLMELLTVEAERAGLRSPGQTGVAGFTEVLRTKFGLPKHSERVAIDENQATAQPSSKKDAPHTVVIRISVE